MRRFTSATLPALLVVAMLCACGGEQGTIAVTVIGAPSGDVLPRIERMEARLTNVEQTFAGRRDDDGILSLAIEVTADGSAGDLIVQGFDSDDALIAVGRVGPLPLAALDASVSVYMAEPLSLAEAPVQLDPPRSHIGAAAASFGVVMAGGRDAEGAIAAVDVYTTYRHTTQPGLDMPAAVSDPAVVPGTTGFFYIVGGSNTEGESTSSSFTFDTTVPPAGTYYSIVMAEEHARSGATAAVVGQDQYIISGDPGLLLDGFQGTARALLNGERLDGPAVTVISNNSLQVVFAGADVEGGAAIYELGQVRRLGAPDQLLRRGHRGIRLPTNEALYLGGSVEGVAVRSAVLYQPESSGFVTVDLLATPRIRPAVAITDRYIVVVGGEADDGSPIGDIEVFDAFTLDPVATIALQVPRSATSAQVLNNGQVLIAGGIDGDGNPTGVLELFTPDE